MFEETVSIVTRSDGIFVYQSGNLVNGGAHAEDKAFASNVRSTILNSGLHEVDLYGTVNFFQPA